MVLCYELRYERQHRTNLVTVVNCLYKVDMLWFLEEMLAI